MRILLQRVSEAAVSISHKEVARIGYGMLVFLGIEEADREEDIQLLCNKMVNLRIFNDEKGQMNISIKDMGGDILLVSQFTLHALVKKGNRPSYIKAAKPVMAKPMFEKFIVRLEQTLGKPIKTGVFGADMQVCLINDGPVTIWMDSKNME